MGDLMKKEYFFTTEKGDSVVTVYTVFPGVQLVYNSIHMDSFDLGFATKGNLIEIHHCLEGRIEHEFDDEVFYLMPGDLSVAIRNTSVKSYVFPTSHYHGITIAINADMAPKCFSQFLADVNVQPFRVAKRLCRNKRCHIIRNQSYIEHIFSELYSVPEKIKKGYFKIKIMELLLVLSEIDVEYEDTQKSLSMEQTLLAKRAADYLLEHIDSRVTIKELAGIFNVSDTYLKKAFKGVFGVPVYTYVRNWKMNEAARLLRLTDRRIADVAYELGYNSESKFVAAFKEVMGDTPGHYRRVSGD